MVIARYISKEIINTFCALVFILMFIAISNKFVTFLAKAAAGKFPISLLVKVVGLYIPELFAILAPVAMFVAILFTHSRLHADSEISVLLTSGFDWARLTRITLMVSIAVAVIVGVINILVVPAISVERTKLLANGQAAGVISSITPGRFQTLDGNEQLVFYVENVLPNGQLQNIFIAQQPNHENLDTEKSVVVTAKTAEIKQDGPLGFYLVLHDGYRYVGAPGTANYLVTSFTEYGRQLKFSSGVIPTNEYTRPSNELLHSNEPADIAELQWRLAMPVAVILLSLIAIPLAKVQPRQGRYAKFLPAVLIYMIYYNLMIIVRRSIANGKLPDTPGLWALHALLLVCAIILLLHVAGRLAEFKYRFFKK